MNIVTFFNNSKKIDLCNNSKGDGAKDLQKLREECSITCEANAGDVFAEGLNDSGCHDISFNCLKELEAKVARYIK